MCDKMQALSRTFPEIIATMKEHADRIEYDVF